MKKHTSLRKHWLRRTLGVALALGITFATVVTVLFALQSYSDLQSDLKMQATGMAEFLNEFQAEGQAAYAESCASAAEAYPASGDVVVQFVNLDGHAYCGNKDYCGDFPLPTDAEMAVAHRSVQTAWGVDPYAGSFRISVSCPLIYGNGEVVGVLRYVADPSSTNLGVLFVGIGAFTLAGLIILLTLSMGSAYIRSILDPVQQITDKAKRIADGAHGLQIKTLRDDEIGELAEAISELSAQVARNEKLQTEFISSLSHELRTPLTAITGWSETLLSDDTLDADTQRGVKIISREAKRLTEMVVDLLDFTRMQDGKMTLNVSMTDIRAEFEDTVFMYSSRLAQDGIELDYLDNDDPIPEITCDSERLRQVFLNIMDNAAKHGGEGKRIEASIHSEDGFVVVKIRDFGPGIPEDEIPLVKRKFYKGSSKARGSGIGLAVCDEIVQLHGGELILSNAEGGGTLVCVKLPSA